MQLVAAHQPAGKLLGLALSETTGMDKIGG